MFSVSSDLKSVSFPLQVSSVYLLLVYRISLLFSSLCSFFSQLCLPLHICLFSNSFLCFTFFFLFSLCLLLSLGFFFYSKDVYFLRTFFSVPGVILNIDLIVMSDDEFNALDDPGGDELAGSAVIELYVNLRNSCYEEVRKGVEQIADPMFPPQDIMSSYVISLVVFVCAPDFDDLNGTTPLTCSVQCNLTDSSLEDSIPEKGARMVFKQVSKRILLAGHQRCSALRPLTSEGDHERAQRLLRVSQVIRGDGQGIGHAETIKLSKMTSPPTPIERMVCSFLSVTKLVLNYTGAFRCNTTSHLQKPYQ